MQMNTADRLQNVAEEFHADMLGAPFKIILLQSVNIKCDQSNRIIDYSIPDHANLFPIIVIHRTLHPKKLSGLEVRFLRKALNLRAKAIAPRISVCREHFSRYENGAVPLSTASEKLLRLFLFRAAIGQTEYASEHITKLIDLSFDIIFDCNSDDKSEVGDETIIKLKLQTSLEMNNLDKKFNSRQMWCNV